MARKKSLSWKAAFQNVLQSGGSELRLEFNTISGQGARKLAIAIQHNTTLVKVFLGSNKITDEGASNIAEALSHNTSLQVLNLSNNTI